jgi:hypothetical protein
MTTALATFRRHPQPQPQRFLAAHPGSWLQYYDDTPAKDHRKALSARRFDLALARRKQLARCAVAFSAQPFGRSRTERELLCYRTLGIDVDLLGGAENRLLTAEEIDARKEDYLATRLLPFPLKPHWLPETRHGFHALFRIEPQRARAGVEEAAALNRRLVRVLGGDENAMLATQLFRVPNTLQFKEPARPFLCRLLIDNAATIKPYSLNVVRSVLDATEVFCGPKARPPASITTTTHRRSLWQEGLGGVPEGRRNATAASLVGRLLRDLPEELWPIAWGGLAHWNASNAAPLPERELRSVFDSIARREQAQRRTRSREAAVRGDPSRDVPPLPC